MADQETKIVITAVDKASAALNTIGSGIDQLKGRVGALDSLAGKLPAITGGLVAGLGAATFSEAIKGSIDYMAKLNDMSLATGASVESLSAMKTAAKLADTTLDDVAVTIAKLSQNLGDARLKGGDKAKLFDALGVDPKTVKDSGQALLDIAVKIDSMSDKTKALALAREALGKNVSMPFLQELAQQGELIAKVTSAQAAAADQFNDNLVKLRGGAGQIGIALANGVLPAMNEILSFSLEVKKEWGAIAAILVGIGGGSVLKLFGVDLDPVKRAADDTAEAFKNLSKAREALANTEAGAKQSSVIPGMGDLRKSLVDDRRKDVEAAEKQLKAAIARQERIAQEASTQSASGKNKSGFSIGDGKLDTSGPSAYEKLMKSLHEMGTMKDAELGGLLNDSPITEIGKKYAKFLSDLTDGSLKLSSKQIESASIQWDKIIKSDQAVEEAKNAAKGMEIVRSLTEGFKRDNAAKMDSMAIMPESQRTLANELRKVDEAAQKARESLEREVKDKNSDAYKKRLEEINAALADQKDRVADLAKEQQTLNSSWEYGADKALQGYVDQISNVAVQTEQMMARAFGGMEDALAEFVVNGKADFSSFARSVLKDLAMMEVRASITLPLFQSLQAAGGFAGLFSGLFGGGSGSSGVSTDGSAFEAGAGQMMAAKGAWFDGQVSAFAKGGAFTNQIVNSPTMFKFASGGSFRNGLMGEAGPEAIMPLRRGPDGRLGVAASGGGGDTIHLNLTVQTGVSQTVRAELAAMMPSIQAATTAAVVDARRRGGAMRKAFS